MASKLPTIWEIEPHTLAKHAILKRYLDAWLPIMSSFNGRIVYIDGFAGPGKYKGGEEGSPIIAIDAVVNHRQKIDAEMIFLFIEVDKERCEHLKQLVDGIVKPTNLKCECKNSKFDETLSDIFKYLNEQRKKLAPTFAFIDPFGFSDTPLEVIKKIMSNPKCEVLITFMYGFINRFLDHPDLTKNYDALFGTDQWKEATKMQDPDQRKAFIHQLYKDQLEKEAKIKYVRSFEMINKQNQTEYFLFFGTNNITGLKKMKESMWKVDQLGMFTFYDNTDPNQLVLLEATPQFDILEKMINDRFAGETAGIEDIQEFVLAKTPFRETHFKKQILLPMEESTPPKIKVITARRKGTYPPGTRIKFC